MTTYKVILTGVLDGLEPEQVAPQLALLCKVPVEGAKALLASQGMVIRRALNAETAAMYKAALRQDFSNIFFRNVSFLLEEDFRFPAPSNFFEPSTPRAWRNPLAYG